MYVALRRAETMKIVAQESLPAAGNPRLRETIALALQKHFGAPPIA